MLGGNVEDLLDFIYIALGEKIYLLELFREE
jgi:hypothetical protein